MRGERQIYLIQDKEGRRDVIDNESLTRRKSKTKKTKVDIWNAEHPARKKAIYIMESIAERVGNETIFDTKADDDTRWFDIEDFITRVIAGKTKK